MVSLCSGEGVVIRLAAQYHLNITLYTIVAVVCIYICIYVYIYVC